MFLLGLLQANAKTAVELTWILSGALLMVVLLGGTYFFCLRFAGCFGRGQETPSEPAPAKSFTDNPTAFMTASMQAVIQKLREQEKELAALQQARSRTRATNRETERSGDAQHARRSAADQLGRLDHQRESGSGNRSGRAALSYRRYTEALGTQSPLAKLLAKCLAEARTYRREEIEYATPGGELRQTGRHDFADR